VLRISNHSAAAMLSDSTEKHLNMSAFSSLSIPCALGLHFQLVNPLNNAMRRVNANGLHVYLIDKLYKPFPSR